MNHWAAVITIKYILHQSKIKINTGETMLTTTHQCRDTSENHEHGGPGVVHCILKVGTISNEFMNIVY